MWSTEAPELQNATMPFSASAGSHLAVTGDHPGGTSSATVKRSHCKVTSTATEPHVNH